MTTTAYQRGQALGAADTTTDCCVCGIEFAMPAEFYRVRHADQRNFFCPQGHEQHFVKGKTNNELLREKLERAENRERYARDEARQARERTQRERRSHAATKGQLTKTKKRVAAGACPCCKRSFVDLARHMAGQHPDYGQPS